MIFRKTDAFALSTVPLRRLPLQKGVGLHARARVTPVVPFRSNLQYSLMRLASWRESTEPGGNWNSGAGGSQELSVASVAKGGLIPFRQRKDIE